MFFVVQEIGIAGINKQRFYIMLFDILCIGFLEIEQVLIRNRLLVTAVPFFYVLLQLAYRSMQVNKNIWLYELLMNDIKQSLIKPEFIIGQCNFCKQQAFGKKIIGDSKIVEHVFLLDQVFELLIAFSHKKQFNRKSILRWIFIKLGEKRIV